MQYTTYTTQSVTVNDVTAEVEVSVNGASTYLDVEIGEVELESGVEVEIEIDEDEFLDEMDFEQVRDWILARNDVSDLVSFEDMTDRVIEHAEALGLVDTLKLLDRLVGVARKLAEPAPEPEAVTYAQSYLNPTEEAPTELA